MPMLPEPSGLKSLSDVGPTPHDKIPLPNPKWRPLKAPPADPRTYTFSVQKCNCRYYNAIVGTILKTLDLQHWVGKK